MAKALGIRTASMLLVALSACAGEATIPDARGTQAEPLAARDELPLELSGWKPIASQSGSVNYYAVVEDPAKPFLRALYRPGYQTAVLGYPLQATELRGARTLRWRWRVLKFPAGGQECKRGWGDSAASVYVSWKRGLRWYSLKHSWSPTAPKGTSCRTKRELFITQDTVVLESGGPLNIWRDEEIDLRRAFRDHFGDGDPAASVPDLAGVALLTDGDQTRSASEADYAGFVLVR